MPADPLPPTAPAAVAPPARAELGDAPPFLSWRRIYLIVVGALAVEIALGALLTAVYR